MKKLRVCKPTWRKRSGSSCGPGGGTLQPGNPRLHDREVRFSSGWTVKVGRGFDIYQRPDDWLQIGANDLDLSPCLETTVDVFPTKSPAS
jgi:hypothetical protein